MDGKCANDSNQRNKNKFKIENPISTAINVHHDIKPIKRTMDKLSPKYPRLNRMLTSKQKKRREREKWKRKEQKRCMHTSTSIECPINNIELNVAAVKMYTHTHFNRRDRRQRKISMKF